MTLEPTCPWLQRMVLWEAKCVFLFICKTSVKIGALIRAKRDLELELRGFEVRRVGDKRDGPDPQVTPMGLVDPAVPLYPLPALQLHNDHMARASRPQSALRRCQEGPPLLQLRRVESLGFNLSANKVADAYVQLWKVADRHPSYFPAKLTPSCLFRTVGCLVEPRRERGLEGPWKLFVAETTASIASSQAQPRCCQSPGHIQRPPELPQRRMAIDSRPPL